MLGVPHARERRSPVDLETKVNSRRPVMRVVLPHKMASKAKRDFLKAVAPILKAHGFKKKDATWHRTCEAVIQTFNVQGSQWSKAFYLNLGIYIKAIGDSTTPPEYACHIQNRVDDLVDDVTRYNQLLDFENNLPAEERFRELNEIIEARAIPWLNKFSNIQNIIDLISGDQSHGLPVTKAVYEHFGVDQQPGRTKIGIGTRIAPRPPCGQKTQPWSLIFENLGSNTFWHRNVGPWA